MNGVWQDPGERVHGISEASGDRALVVRNGSFEFVHATMDVTTVKRVVNLSTTVVRLLDVNMNMPAREVSIGPGQDLPADMSIPWAARPQDFLQDHLEPQPGGQTRFWIWQAARLDGDFVRFSVSGAWQDPGLLVHGMAAVGGDRTIVVRDGCFELVISRRLQECSAACGLCLRPAIIGS
jgi:hypothetical protein